MDFFVTSVTIYNLFSSAYFYLPITCIIAVKNDYGLKNLEIIITFGISKGLFLNSSNYANRYSKL
jgi:hypothetical protein